MQQRKYHQFLRITLNRVELIEVTVILSTVSPLKQLSEPFSTIWNVTWSLIGNADRSTTTQLSAAAMQNLSGTIVTAENRNICVYLDWWFYDPAVKNGREGAGRGGILTQKNTLSKMKLRWKVL